MNTRSDSDTYQGTGVVVSSGGRGLLQGIIAAVPTGIWSWKKQEKLLDEAHKKVDEFENTQRAENFDKYLKSSFSSMLDLDPEEKKNLGEASDILEEIDKKVADFEKDAFKEAKKEIRTTRVIGSLIVAVPLLHGLYAGWKSHRRGVDQFDAMKDHIRDQQTALAATPSTVIHDAEARDNLHDMSLTQSSAR